ncbi:Hsp20/alpha crystallin family protein [Nafulsella turpanensis]|uniref:hypothetical protein n=1 Tax=Nafulsella turpanensis TaxID=1265690 RepID=UPI000345FD15|nr:hypothetical protein [Nafulsella turpanensis]
MNLLKNKKLLRGLLLQGDLLNTINGGVSMTHVVKEQHDENFTIILSAPSIPADAYNVVLNGQQLMVFSLLPDSTISKENEVFSIPLFYENFELPSYIDLDNIEAIHQGSELMVILPFKETARFEREIDINHI